MDKLTLEQVVRPLSRRTDNLTDEIMTCLREDQQRHPYRYNNFEDLTSHW